MKIDTHNAYQLPSRSTRRLGYIAMLGLLSLAIIFYKERAFLLDIAFQTFLMINEGTVQVMVNRFGSAIVQLLPLLAIKSGAPIWVVSLFYSMSFPLLFLLIYVLIVKVFKNDLLGWALVFLFILIVYDAFYWATSEQQQGLAVLLLFYAYLLRFPKLNQWWHWPVNFFGVSLLAFYHPLIFIPFYFLWAFFLLHQPKQFLHWRYMILVVIMAAVLVAKSRYFSNWYDSGKMNTFQNNLDKYFPNYFGLAAHGKFLKNCLYYWYLFPIFFAVDIIYYLFKKYWLKAILVGGFCFAYLMLLHIASPESNYRFYVEVNYMALSIFVMVPFLFDIAPQLRTRNLFLLFTSIVLLRLATIAWHHQPYTARIEWIRQALEQGTEQQPAATRFYLPASKVPMDTLLMPWGIPYESLLISTYDGHRPRRTLFVHQNMDQFRDTLQIDTTFVTEFKVYSLKELNFTYFPLDTNAYRKVISQED